jgi:SAM-dependent methyltransferase
MHGGVAPSAWVERFASMVPSDAVVLDVACGGGRHSRLFLDRGHEVVAVDRDTSGLDDLRHHPRLRIVQADLEVGGPVEVLDERFGVVIVTSYLHRPLLPALVSAVDDRGLLLYETFATGNERFGRPTNPRFLLRPGELLDAVRGQLRVVAYEDVTVVDPRPAALQRIAAVRDAGS